MTKQEDAIELIIKNPTLNNMEVGKLASCSVRTAERARATIRAHLTPKPPIEEVIRQSAKDDSLDKNDPVELLVNTCIKELRKPKPDGRWGTILKDILIKTGKLDVKIQEEEECKAELNKLSAADLVAASIGKNSQGKSSPREEQDGNFYS